MKIFGITSIGLLCIVLFCFIIFSGLKVMSLFLGVTPAFAQVVNALLPKVVQTPTQVIIFDNPLVDQEGMAVEDVVDNRSRLIGQEVTVKGRVGNIDEPWGFWLVESNGGRDEVFIITNAEVANQDVDNFTITGQRYVRVRGVVKEMAWTNEDSLDAAINDDGSIDSREKRLAIVASQINTIPVAE